MKEYEDTLQVCTMHRILQTLSDPCPKCMEEIRREQEAKKTFSEQVRAMVS